MIFKLLHDIFQFCVLDYCCVDVFGCSICGFGVGFFPLDIIIFWFSLPLNVLHMSGSVSVTLICLIKCS